ncbi:MAG: GAF domain-containing protein [Armatimonadota bacterium]|nr:GAF domain-containing protein [Armatimonadota bacterium]MDR7436289.1 GAF domain-containing protein [Armatimonadota bacterium]MDR7471331.1 GAF domain-containing protein [Armatimonadota bacterium]MDR7506457.1 GAF domain-containing protein [Armatimonadota bacterium]MDR7516524.1 GAF domain-containing protein [Armatimonadota bacterium]
MDGASAPARHPSSEIAALRAISRAIGSALDLDSTLHLITRTTAEVMGVDSCSIYLLDPAGEYLVLKATTGLAPDAVGRARLRVGEGLTGWAVREGRPVASSDAASDPRFVYLPETREYAFRSLAAVPLVTAGRVLGAINVQTTAVWEYTPDQMELLGLIADLAAGAIEKAALYDDMRRQIMELSTLAEVSQTLTSPLYLEDVLRLIVEMAARMLNAATCALMLVDEATGELVTAAVQSAGPAYLNRPRLRVGDGITGLVAREGRPIAVEDVLADPRFVAKDVARQEGLRALLSVPLVVRDRVIGVFNCYRAHPHRFTDAEVKLLTTLANQTALAIENATLVMRSAVIREMHHRVKNNLQTIAMLLRLQLRDGREVSGREVLTETINRILSIAAVHEILSGGGFRSISLRQLLERIAGNVLAAVSRPDLQLTVEVEGDDVHLTSQQATSLGLAVNELLQNAVEHAFPQRAEGRIRITIAREGSGLRVVVEDNGRGVPPGFDPQASADLGLKIVHALVTEDLGGTLEYAGGTGTRALITLPRLERPYG